MDSYARDDGQWDLEAELIDIKAYDFPKAGGLVQKAGDPVHHMHLRVTFNHDFAITDAVAAYDAAPYGGQCSAIAPDYRNLIGMNLLQGFRQAVKERFGRVAGCTHMTELAYVLPTVAVQSLSGKRRKEQQSNGNKRPFQLGGCHALRLDGPVVQEFYPQWYAAPREPANSK